MSFKPEVIVDSSGKWCGTPPRFATREEAEANVRDPAKAAEAMIAVVESDDPVKYSWHNGKLIAVEK